MWKNLYDTLLQTLTTSWASYISSYSRQGRLVRDSFFNEIYQSAGAILVIVSLISTLLYYFYFNSQFGRYYKIKSWFKCMIFTSLLIGLATLIIGKSFLGSFSCPTFSLIMWLSIINILYGIILFFLLSVICQLFAILVRKLFYHDLSPMASRTPF